MLHASPPQIVIQDVPGEAVILRFSGDWQMTGDTWPYLSFPSGKTCRSVDLQAVGMWDSSLVALLYRIRRLHPGCELLHPPEGIPELLGLALAKDLPSKPPVHPASFYEKLGETGLYFKRAGENISEFIGEVTFSFLRLIKHKAWFRHRDFLELLAECGYLALPIVTLISFLVGLVLAFVGSMQLKDFGAQIYVADLVGIAMAREMGAMMTGIIMAGRTGASYAARLGTMQVNEEIDALRTSGINPIDFLVLPRTLALLAMLPLLCVYADIVGIAGGMSIGVWMLDLSPEGYWNETLASVSLGDFWAGLFKSLVFAVVVALAGCYHGLRCGRSSQAVGNVTTKAVVSGIVGIVVTDSILTVIYDVLGI